MTRFDMAPNQLDFFARCSAEKRSGRFTSMVARSLVFLGAENAGEDTRGGENAIKYGLDSILVASFSRLWRHRP